MCHFVLFPGTARGPSQGMLLDTTRPDANGGDVHVPRSPTSPPWQHAHAVVGQGELHSAPSRVASRRL